MQPAVYWVRAVLHTIVPPLKTGRVDSKAAGMQCGRNMRAIMYSKIVVHRENLQIHGPTLNDPTRKPMPSECQSAKNVNWGPEPPSL